MKKNFHYQSTDSKMHLSLIESTKILKTSHGKDAYNTQQKRTEINIVKFL